MAFCKTLSAHGRQMPPQAPRAPVSRLSSPAPRAPAPRGDDAYDGQANKGDHYNHRTDACAREEQDPLMSRQIFLLDRKGADRFLLRKSTPRVESIISVVNTTGDASGLRPPYGVRVFRGRKLVLRFDDDDSATTEDVARLVRFVRWASSPLLIHCEAGISRSAACAVISRAVWGEVDVTQDLKRGVHRPNRHLLDLVDGLHDTFLAEAVERWYAEEDS